MPFVHAIINNHSFNGRYADSIGHVDELIAICEELVPAALSCKHTILAPGNIRFISTPPNTGQRTNLKADVLLHIQAQSCDDRAADTDTRAHHIQSALMSLLPTYSFDIWIQLGSVGWVTEFPDDDVDWSEDLTLTGAYDRAFRKVRAINEQRSNTDLYR